MPAACIIGIDGTAAGWAARCALNGWAVAVVDPDPAAPDRLGATLTRARRWYPSLLNGALPPEGAVQIHADPAGCVPGADLVLVCQPDLLGAEVPRRLRALAPEAVIAAVAATPAGFDASVAGTDLPWLLPLAQLSGDSQAVDQLCALLTALGMAPLMSDAAGTLRAGWDAARPALTPAAVQALGPGLLAACGDLPEEDRDAALTGMLRSLKDRNLGAGRILTELDARRAGSTLTDLGDLVRLQVLPAWIDYNGHMTESRYLFACSEITDALLLRIGAGPDHVATGFSYYTAETHIRHRGETKVGDWLTGSVQVLMADAKRIHLFVTLRRGDQVVATLEQMLLHVDMAANRACPAPPQVLDRLLLIAEAHRGLPPPEGAGRRVGERRVSG